MKFNWDKIKNAIFENGGNGNSSNDNDSGITYSELLGIDKKFQFSLIMAKVTSDTEFTNVENAALRQLKADFKRLGMEFEEIPSALKNNLIGEIGSIIIIGDDDGNLTVRFHKRNSDGNWDDNTKKYPEKDTTAKYKFEAFFPINEE